MVLDSFAHSGSTLLTAEILDRSCCTSDIDPLFCEIAIRRLEQFRRTGKLGWQNGHAFEHEIPELPHASDGDGTARPRVLSSQPTLFG